MVVDALILAGGRSSRLGGSVKQKLRVGNASLLDRTVDAVRAAGVRHVVVVGDGGPDGTTVVREDPVFGGPVAAIAAGLDVLPADADVVLVLACDMPGIAPALPGFVRSIAGDGVVAVDRGRRQQLVFAARARALRAAVAVLPTVVDASVRSLLEQLDLTDVAVPDGATDDIDTWDDAARFGAVPPEHVRSAT
jgi:Molybdopterin-guanine dinucleotide biosynthesis protein A